jgi:hypothetical protein
VASVFETADGTWRAQIRKRGIRDSRNFRTKAEAEAWAIEREGLSKPDREVPPALRQVSELLLDYPAIDNVRRVPPPLRRIKGLCVLPFGGCRSGVYFLCRGHTVLYVGQSVEPILRIRQHVASGDFDRAYVLPVPRKALDRVEGAFIRSLKPPLNRDVRGGDAKTDTDTIHDFAIRMAA